MNNNEQLLVEAAQNLLGIFDKNRNKPNYSPKLSDSLIKNETNALRKALVPYEKKENKPSIQIEGKNNQTKITIIINHRT